MMYQICLTAGSAAVFGVAFVEAVAVGVSEAAPNTKEVATKAEIAIREPLPLARIGEVNDGMNFFMVSPNPTSMESGLRKSERVTNLHLMVGFSCD